MFPFSHFILLANNDQNQMGRTKLDKERLKLCVSEVVSWMIRQYFQTVLTSYVLPNCC